MTIHPDRCYLPETFIRKCGLVMPLADLLDRLSIAMLKKHAGQLDVDEEIAKLEEAWALHDKFCSPAPEGSLQRLLIHNAMIWSLESDIRAGMEDKLGLEEVGRRAIRIREHNKKRVAVKQEIAKACGEFVEQKTDHASA